MFGILLWSMLMARNVRRNLLENLDLIRQITTGKQASQWLSLRGAPEFQAHLYIPSGKSSCH